MSFQDEFDAAVIRAETGDVVAQREVGQALLRGTTVPRDLDRGRMWLQRAIDQNDVEALRMLATHDLLAGKLGRGPHSAWELLQRGANWGDESCALDVARGIEHGQSLSDVEQKEYFTRTGLPHDLPNSNATGESA